MKDERTRGARADEGGMALPTAARRLIFDAVAVRSLGKVLAALGEAGIVAAPVKGIVLARWLYGDAAERPFVDVDLLVARVDYAAALRVVRARGWRIVGESTAMGELLMLVDDIPIELHAEVGRRELSRLTTADLLARATEDRTTFPFLIRRVDDVDHFLLLVLNVVKDGFTYANPHQAGDLERMLDRLGPRGDELGDRARAAGMLTALHATASWMRDLHDSTAFADLDGRLPPHRRRVFLTAVDLHRRLTSRQPSRLRSPTGMLGLALATLSADDLALRGRGLARLFGRGLLRRLGREPD